MARQVIFLPEVGKYLEVISFILYDEGYFGLKKSCIEYIGKLVNYANQCVGIIADKPAPPYFIRYGWNMRYITYHENKKTSWYIFFQHENDKFLIRYITNNHVAAQYF
jgi:hypothetical protein